MLTRVLAAADGNITLFWAVPDFARDLRAEFDKRRSPEDEVWGEFDGNLIVRSPSREAPLTLAWARSTWHHLQLLKFDSIGQAAKFLDDGQSPRRYVSASLAAHRRAELIQEKLRGYPKVWRDFRESLAPTESFGGFLMLDENHLAWSGAVRPRLPLDGPVFNEDKTAPSRAYLKLWESFHRFGELPIPKAKCFELGASPGGWTTVLRSLEAEVWATDRAELAPALMKDPLVHFEKGDGFQWNPGRLPEMDWVFSDVICYPEKLWDWVQPWLALPRPPKMLCTIKFQGETDYETLMKFAQVPRSQLVHLFQNKHELTWFFSP